MDPRYLAALQAELASHNASAILSKTEMGIARTQFLAGTHEQAVAEYILTIRGVDFVSKDAALNGGLIKLAGALARDA